MKWFDPDPGREPGGPAGAAGAIRSRPCRARRPRAAQRRRTHPSLAAPYRSQPSLAASLNRTWRGMVGVGWAWQGTGGQGKGMVGARGGRSRGEPTRPICGHFGSRPSRLRLLSWNNYSHPHNDHARDSSLLLQLWYCSRPTRPN